MATATGTCAMCLERKRLCDSHFMPKSLYGMCTAPEFEPVRISKTLMHPTSKQTTHHLLCHDCEQRLSREGENWVLPLLPRVNTAFPLLDRVRRQAAVYDDGVRQLYATGRNPDVDTAKILHFAVGIFWKASAHSWRAGRVEPAIDLGTHAEGLRQFLLGEADLPRDIAVAISIDNAPKRFIGFVEPYRVQHDHFSAYCVFVSGFVANLYTGTGCQEMIGPLCLNGNPDCPVMVEELSKLMRNISRTQTVDVRQTKKLRENRAEIERRGLGIRLGD